MAQAPDIKKYCDLMEEVKLRMSVADHFLSGRGNAVYEPPTMESVCLQLRKILELIAFGSLIANRDAYSTAYSKISKTWNAGDILRELREVNPSFYPVPVIQVPSKQPGVFMEHKKREPVDYLTEDEFKEVYGRCGTMAHAANPFGKDIDFKYYAARIPEWRAKIVNLLNAHEIHLVDRPGMYVVFMSVHGSDRVHWTGFEPGTPAPIGSQ